MLAEISIDWSAMQGYVKYAVAAAVALLGVKLLGGGGSWLPFPKLSLNKPVAPSERSSDQLPPAGFVEHMEIIEKASPNADAVVWWAYAKQGLTEAQVARAEASMARVAADKSALPASATKGEVV
jgi:hypothetical protein